MSVERRNFLSLLTIGLPASLGLSSAMAQDQEPKAPPQNSRAPVGKKGIPPQEDLDRWLTEKLANCVFSGSYSVTQGADEKSAVMEKYAISRVTKVNDTSWLFAAKWQIQGKEFPIAIPLTILWAGKTPVITLEEVTIPGLGTFSSRVLIHEDWYAGTWSHGKVGGHLWGRIEHPGKPEANEGDQKDK